MRCKVNLQEALDFEPSNLKVTNEYYRRYETISRLLDETAAGRNPQTVQRTPLVGLGAAVQGWNVTVGMVRLSLRRNPRNEEILGADFGQGDATEADRLARQIIARQITTEYKVAARQNIEGPTPI